MTLWHVLLGLSLFFIAAQLINLRIKGRIDRASEQIAERDSDWRHSVPKGFQVPDGCEQVGLDERRAA